jgi:hypothetical protein
LLLLSLSPLACPDAARRHPPRRERERRERERGGRERERERKREK